MIVETNELARHYELVERLPKQRAQAEIVLRMVGDEIELPVSLIEEAEREAVVIDTFLPILVQRSRGLGQIAETETLSMVQSLEGYLKNVHQIPRL